MKRITSYRKNAICLLASLSLGSFLVACSTTQPNYQTVGNLNNLNQLQNLHAKATPSKKQMTGLHAQALQDIAMSIGALNRLIRSLAKTHPIWIVFLILI